tara:strand:- start:3068 stop:3301 length:234 start_codon:yes stop_codon:yes gene_type:complete
MTPEELKTAYQQTFKSKQGEIVLNDLAQRLHFFTTTWSEKIEELTYKEGQRSVLLWINRQVQDTPAPTQETATTEEE